MFKKEFFLSSLESRIFGTTRRCTYLRKLYFDTGKECVLAEIEPPVIGQQFGYTEDIKYVVITTRHEGGALFDNIEFPCFVFIAYPLNADIENIKNVTKDELKILAWGELYETRQKADNHTFD